MGKLFNWSVNTAPQMQAAAPPQAVQSGYRQRYASQTTPPSPSTQEMTQ
jgi:hypothetical protein